MSKEEPYTPKVGDRIRITKSNENWAPGMDDFVGREVVVTSVHSSKNVKFEGDGNYFWNHVQGHFVPVPEESYQIY